MLHISSYHFVILALVRFFSFMLDGCGFDDVCAVDFSNFHRAMRVVKNCTMKPVVEWVFETNFATSANCCEKIVMKVF